MENLCDAKKYLRNGAVSLMGCVALALVIKRTRGPYWLGENISLVDLTFYPFMEQAPVLAHYRDFEMPGSGSLPHLHAWIDTMKKRPSVLKNKRDIEFYIEAYEYFVA